MIKELLNSMERIQNQRMPDCIDVVGKLLSFVNDEKKCYQFERLGKAPWASRLIDSARRELTKRLSGARSRNGTPIVVDPASGAKIASECISTVKLVGIRSRRPEAGLFIARGLAEAIDGVYVDSWIPMFCDRLGCDGPVEIRKGEVFPIASSLQHEVARELFGGEGVETIADRSNMSINRLTNVGLLTAGPHRVTLDLRLVTHANEEFESGRFRVATGLMNRLEEVDLDVVEQEDNVYCCNVDMRAFNREFSSAEIVHSGDDWSTQQFDRIVRIIKLAAQEKVDVLVLPELCMNERIQNLTVQYAARNPSPSIFVLGSAHICSHINGKVQQSNRLQMLVQCGRPFLTEHMKFNPVTNVKWEQKDRRTDSRRKYTLDELLSEDDGPQIPILLGRWTSVATLICKDLLHSETRSFWSLLRPNLILVPAFSRITEPFRTAAKTAAEYSKAIAVVADNGISPENIPLGGGDEEQESPTGERVQKHSHSKQFATFGYHGRARGVAHEPPFENTPRLPVLFVLEWASKEPTGEESDVDVPFVRAVN